MKAYKNIKNLHPDNLYVNIILLLFFLIIGVCVVRACETADLSANNLNSSEIYATSYLDDTCLDMGY